MCNRLGAWCPRLQHRSVFGFPFASRNPFFTISSVISTSWTSEVPPTYSIYIRVCNQTYLSNLFALFPKKRDIQLVSETIRKKVQCLSFFVILTGKTFFINILLAKDLDFRCVNSIRLHLRHFKWSKLPPKFDDI